MQPNPQRDYILTWSIQAALSGGLAVAAAGLALVFRRPVLRVVGAAAATSALASVLIWLSLSAEGHGWSGDTGLLFTALAFPISPFLMTLLYGHILRLVAGQTTSPWPSVRVLCVVIASGYLIAFAVYARVAGSGGGWPSVIGMVSSSFAFAAYAVLCLLALRWRRASRRPTAVAMLAAAFGMLALQSGTNVIVTLLAVVSGERPEFGAGIATLQIFLLVSAGGMVIIAALEEERASGIERAERLRAAEVAMAHSARLESLGKMAGAVAHGFNNLLSAIKLGAQTVRLGGADVDEEMRDVEAAAERGQELTRQLLAFAHQKPQQVARFDANAQLDKCSGLLRRMAGKSTRMDIALAATPLIVEMDPGQFDQVAMNLVSNARDAMPDGGTVTMCLALSPRGEAGEHWVRMSVADTGVGIPDEVRPYIFEPFFSTKKASEGTGLGLATCDGIVRQAGGQIEVHTTPARGTRFDILLPHAKA
ncbi:MAG: hypothetical protein FJ202_05840 [Gemmatimonadetes bacterium]|nr:hypothetical protein [Gemmatimonadota bacterium]